MLKKKCEAIRGLKTPQGNKLELPPAVKVTVHTTHSLANQCSVG